MYGMNVAVNQIPDRTITASNSSTIRRTQNRALVGFALCLAAGDGVVDSCVSVELVTCTPLFAESWSKTTRPNHLIDLMRLHGEQLSGNVHVNVTTPAEGRVAKDLLIRRSLLIKPLTDQYAGTSMGAPPDYRVVLSWIGKP